MEIKGFKKINEFLSWGILFLLVGYCLIILEKNDYGISLISDFSPLISYLSPLISSAGLALILIALVETRHLKNFLESTADKIVHESSDKLDKKFNESFNYLESTADKIVHESSDKLDKKFKDSFNLLKQCEENGLIQVLPPRQDTNKFDEARKVIAKEIEKTNIIYIFSISGLDFFNYIGGPQSGSGKYHELILQRLDKAKKENKSIDLEIKVLLMNPKSDAAKFRMEIENISVHKSTQEKDLEISKEGIDILNKMNQIPFIKHLQYSEFPQVGFVMTDSYVFIEPYHFAPTEIFCKALNIENLSASTTHSSCTGGRIPVFQFKKKSNMYIAMQKHFDSIWNYETLRQTT